MRKNTSRSAIYPCRSFLDGLEDSKQTTTAGADWPCFVSFCPITLMPSIDLASSRVHTHSSLTSTARSNCNPERSEEHTSELQSLMRNSYAVFCLKKKTKTQQKNSTNSRQIQHHK